MRIYFDYNATTPLLPAVVDAMSSATRDLFGNASSVHFFGQQAKAAIDTARSSVASLIGADPLEIGRCGPLIAEFWRFWPIQYLLRNAW